jgi:uncharacterized protein
MIEVTLRFYEELNDFLPTVQRKKELPVSFEKPRSVKDLIESLGVPHTEVDLILKNNTSVDFTCLIKENCRIAVYPVFESIDIRNAKHLAPPLRQTRFIAEHNLMKLAKLLRALGLDTICEPSLQGEELIARALKENRIILSRGTSLLKRKEVTHGMNIHQENQEAALAEVLSRVDLYQSIRPFSRCLLCNATLQSIPQNEVLKKIPPKVAEWCHHFTSCSGCQRIYWPGSHYARICKILEKNKINVGPQIGP